MSSIGYCLTPKQVVVGFNDMKPCPPPPRASLQVIEMLVPAQEVVRDAPLGFFLAAPCNSSNANHRSEQFKNQRVKLLPKKSRSNHIKLHIKKNSTDWALGTTAASFEDTHLHQGLSAGAA